MYRDCGALRAEFVLLNFNGRSTLFKAHYPAPRYQLQRDLIVELNRPANVQFQTPPGKQHVFGREQHAGTRNIEGSAFARFIAAALIQDPESDIPFDRESIRVPPVGLHFIGHAHRTHLAL